MKNPNIKTKVIHSESKPAWNVIGTKLGSKYKIARCPYIVSEGTDDTTIKINLREKAEALVNAGFISWCFNHSDIIIHELIDNVEE